MMSTPLPYFAAYTGEHRSEQSRCTTW